MPKCIFCPRKKYVGPAENICRTVLVIITRLSYKTCLIKSVAACGIQVAFLFVKQQNKGVEVMSKKITKLLIGFLFVLTALSVLPVKALAAESTNQEEFRVGMEAGYPPFNWTQSNSKNGAVPIQGSDDYAGGYDVQIAKIIAEKLGKKLVIVKTSWDGLPPALSSNTIDAIIAGMSPTAERKKTIDFSNSYYKSDLVVVVRKDSKYANATSLKDLSGATITGQLNTFHYDVIPQIPGVKKQTAMKDFPAMRVSVESGTVDGYVSERPEGITAEEVNPDLKMIEFKSGEGFKTNPEDTEVSVGMRKGDADLPKINEILSAIPESERQEIMDKAIKDQPASTETDGKAAKKTGTFAAMTKIVKKYGNMFLRGTGQTLLISLVGTVIGLVIGLLIGIFRTSTKPENKAAAFFYKILNGLLAAYIEIFRGTPMMVQAAVIFYGSAQLFGLHLDRLLAAIFIVSVNTGAYMSEIVRGGIFAVDDGQFEAAEALGMTHWQTMIKIVMPQVIRNILPATGNEFVINIKDTSVLSIISVTELFFQGTTVAGATLQFFPTYFIISIIYFILTFTVTRILRAVEKHLDGQDSYIPAANQDQVTPLGKRKE